MRNKLIQDLANDWRRVETQFIETEDDSEKQKVLEKQSKANLTSEELKELEATCRTMGI